MAIESVTADAGSGGASFAVDTITGDVQVPYCKLMSGTDAATDLIGGDATNGLDVDVTRVQGTVAVSNAGLTELAAAINGSSQMDINIAASNATVAVSNAGLTELAAAINASSQMDINIAASNATVAVSNTGLTNLNGAISGTEVQVDVVGALPAGTNAIGKLAANSGVDIGDVDVTSIGAGSNLIGDVGIQGRATGGLSIFKSIDLDESEEEVKGSAGTVYSILAFNRTAAPLYLKFYNLTAANTTVGTSTPIITLVVPANADSDGAGFTHSVAQGYAFDTAISVAATTGVADNDTGTPGANDCIVLIGYK